MINLRGRAGFKTEERLRHLRINSGSIDCFRPTLSLAGQAVMLRSELNLGLLGLLTNLSVPSLFSGYKFRGVFSAKYCFVDHGRYMCNNLTSFLSHEHHLMLSIWCGRAEISF